MARREVPELKEAAEVEELAGVVELAEVESAAGMGEHAEVGDATKMDELTEMGSAGEMGELAEAESAAGMGDTQALNLAQLKQEIHNLRDELATVLLEIDDIVLQVNPRILRDYETTIGCYEADLLREQIAARRAKRKLALLRSALNRGEAPDISAIDGALEQEFAEWEALLQAKVDAYIDSLEMKSNRRPLTEAESKELADLHKTLIKRLHPDMNRGNEEECERFFLLAQEAYEAGNLVVLRSLEVATAHLGRRPKQFESDDDARVELALVEAQISVTKERLEAIKNSNPYLLAAKLADRAWVTETAASLKAETEEQLALREAYEAEIKALVES